MVGLETVPRTDSLGTGLPGFVGDGTARKSQRRRDFVKSGSGLEGPRCFGGARPCSAAPARGSIAAVVEHTQETPDAETALNVGMAAERTWLAWWRTALVATAGALGVGRLAPRLLHAAAAPYVVLGCCYAVLALALLIVGSRRHRALARALERGEPAPLTATTVTLFTVGGVVLATVTTVVVLAQA